MTKSTSSEEYGRSVERRPWVSEAMIEALAEGLNQDLEVDMAVALGILGSKAGPVVARLEKIFDGEITAGSGLALTHGLVLANIDPKKRDAVLRRLLANFDRIGDCHHGWFVITAVSNAYVLVAPLSKELVKFCGGDKDPKVAASAFGLLAEAGLPARGVVPELIEFMRGKADDESRADAAYTLKDLADFTHLPKLEEALKNEGSAKVRKNLDATIKYLKTFESVTWYGPPEWMPRAP